MQLTINQYVDRYGTIFFQGRKRFQHANESLSLYHDIKAYRNEDVFSSKYIKSSSIGQMRLQNI